MRKIVLFLAIMVLCLVSTGQASGAKNIGEIQNQASIWYEDSPYFHLKEKYQTILSSKPIETEGLKEAYDLADFLHTNYFSDWTKVFGKDPKQWDQQAKAYTIYESIVAKYPVQELFVIYSKIRMLDIKHTVLRPSAKEKADDLLVLLDGMLDVSVEDSTKKPKDITLSSKDYASSQPQFEIFKENIADRIIELARGCKAMDAYSIYGQILSKYEGIWPRFAENAYYEKMRLDDELITLDILL